MTSWKVGSVRVEALKNGDYPNLESDITAQLDCFLFPQGKDILEYFGLGRNYRKWARILIYENYLLLFEYEMRGNFGIYKVPLGEIETLETIDGLVKLTVRHGEDIFFRVHKTVEKELTNNIVEQLQQVPQSIFSLSND